MEKNNLLGKLHYLNSKYGKAMDSINHIKSIHFSSDETVQIQWSISGKVFYENQAVALTVIQKHIVYIDIIMSK